MSVCACFLAETLQPLHSRPLPVAHQKPGPRASASRLKPGVRPAPERPHRAGLTLHAASPFRLVSVSVSGIQILTHLLIPQTLYLASMLIKALWNNALAAKAQLSKQSSFASLLNTNIPMGNKKGQLHSSV